LADTSYKGTAIPNLANKYIFADLTGKGVESDRGGPPIPGRALTCSPRNLTLTSFSRDSSGELYLVDYNGIIWKLVLQ